MERVKKLRDYVFVISNLLKNSKVNKFVIIFVIVTIVIIFFIS